MALYADQSTRVATNEAANTAGNSEHRTVREPFTAFNDYELRSWLMKCIENASENFLCAVAEAAVAATAEDYILIRPALLALKRRHKSRKPVVRRTRATKFESHRSAQEQSQPAQ